MNKFNIFTLMDSSVCIVKKKKKKKKGEIKG